MVTDLNNTGKRKRIYTKHKIHYCAKSGLTHFCAIKSPKSTDILLNMYFTDFEWIPLLPVLDSTNISS